MASGNSRNFKKLSLSDRQAKKKASGWTELKEEENSISNTRNKSCNGLEDLKKILKDFVFLVAKEILSSLGKGRRLLHTAPFILPW